MADQAEPVVRNLLGYDLLRDPKQPGVSVIAFKSEEGTSMFAVNRGILETLAEAFKKQAAAMPRE